MITMKKRFKDKKILFIPMFSTRSYKTGRYDLSLDGNMARVVSKLMSINFDTAVITIPMNSDNLDVATKCLDMTWRNISFIKAEFYGENAKATRLNGEKIWNFVKDYLDKFDYIVFEQNSLPEYITSDKDKFIYWCVASITDNGTPWFVKDYEQIDIDIAQEYTTACAISSQVRALQGKSYVEEFYNAKIFDKPIIFFPFRLSDKNYKAEQFKEDVLKLKNLGYDFEVYYTDVNESGIFDNCDFVKIPGQKEVYLSVLKGKPIIPYYDNITQLIHINICEFDFYNCNVVMKQNDEIVNSNFIYVKDDNNFAEGIETAIRRYYNERI